ncbi:oxoglutarate dehydrogenase E1 component [Seminavis robusta]|uniref:Oxoglutarate dehydrogenase E1 component n=1 Tax=Seminavis robusta TaxID=568900 RepID=A0A9N8HYZ9_9STRA|nr:oxoglutarate dehydrogenase E1 component [Seminavis robusta]|eukprot:Sro2129_g315810.1 oxoglutarate dehydrogenase E1 component (797) ;mRNA; f:14446-16917
MMRISTVVSRWGSRSRLLHPSAVATWRQPIQPRLLENKVWTASLSSMAHPQKQRGAFSHDNTIEMVPRSLLAKRHQEALKSSFQRFGYQMANVNPIRPDGLLSVRSAVERCIPKSMVTVLDVLTDIRCYQCNDPDFAKALSEHVAIHKDDAACVAELVHSYCGHIGYEFEHCSTEAERAFFVAIIEDPNSALQQFDDAWIFEQLYRAELFEQLLHERYSNARTFGIEGMESAVLAINTLVETFANTAAEERCKVLLGTTHRGRINFLANCLHTNWSTLISEWDPTSGPTYDDICLGSSSSNNGLIELLPIPAHLEAMVPGLQGKARAHAEELARNLDDETKKGAHHTQSPLATHLVLPLSLHGDASFCGEGIIQETLQLSTCKHYECGGTIHMILNNQVGYTTELSETKSERFLHTQSSDVAKSINAPILHVNANRPRAVVRACQIALLYRQTFGADILIDLVGWRKHGHNELDDPTMTNVDLYKTVKKMESVTEKFMDELAHPASLALAKIDGVKEEVDQIYQAAKGIKRQEAGDLPHEQKTGSGGSSAWSNIKARPSDTSLPEAQFKEALAPLTTVPDEFQLHPIVKRVVDARKKILAMPPETRIDWATAELLALSSLATEGVPVRLTGEDTERGTFAQRHAVWHDMAKQGHEHHAVPPLLEIANSPLSELSVVGFEFGWSLCNPNSLCLWEAQFGDFSDEAQVIFDTLISSSASKWNEESNLVLLLPHGYDGMGPDHSSCRPERWLQMFASSWSEADSPPTGDPDPVEAFKPATLLWLAQPIPPITFICCAAS